MTPAHDSVNWQALVPVLRDVEAQPGRHALRRREPRVLFEQVHTVLLLAAGRPLEGIAEWAGPREDEARRAARFFVRTALLRQGVDHYTLLGLERGADAAQLREHWRLLIRMTHPDAQAALATEDAWPADAASRINRAHDVLADASRRMDYDASLDAAAAIAPPPAAKKPRRAARVKGGARAAPQTAAKPTPAARRPDAAVARTGRERASTTASASGPAAAGAAHTAAMADGRGGSWLSRLSPRVKMALASVGALLSAGALVVLSPSDSGSLSARRTPGASASGLSLSTGLSAPAGERVVAPVLPDPAQNWEDPVGAAALAGSASRPAGSAAPVTTATASAARTPAVGAAATSGGPQAPGSAMRAMGAGTDGVALRGARALSESTKGAAADSGEGEGSVARLSGLALESRLAGEAVAGTVTATTTTPETGAPPSMAQIQPVLRNLMASLPDGRAETLLQWVDGAWRQRPANRAFAQQYDQWLAGQSVARLGKVAFHARDVGATTVVDGEVELHLQGAGGAVRVRELQLRASFLSQDGRAVLTQLVASEGP